METCTGMALSNKCSFGFQILKCSLDFIVAFEWAHIVHEQTRLITLSIIKVWMHRTYI